MKACWCGCRTLEAFTEDYGRCTQCGGLVYLGEVEAPIGPDDGGFYGRTYWNEHQGELGHPPLEERARSDLIERNMFWLQSLLAYCQPPARVLEVGCGHGSFVALLQAAGYQATGLDLSPWVVAFARTTFQIPVVQGRVAEQAFKLASFDCIVMMDVLEHLTDPVGELRDCLRLLKTDGLLVIQTPRYPGWTLSELTAADSPFLNMLLPVEHLHLFSKASVQRFLHELGVQQVAFEPALYPYDMFLFASRRPLDKASPESISNTLEADPARRPVLGLLDLYKRHRQLTERYQQTEHDRSAGLKQMHDLTDWLNQSETDRAARLEQIHELTRLLEVSEADRAARQEQINELTSMLNTSEADRSARLEQINELTGLLQVSESDRQDRLEQIRELTRLLQTSETDRQDRLEQIQELTVHLQASESDRQDRLEQIHELTELLNISETDRAARYDQLQTLTDLVRRLQARSPSTEHQPDGPDSD